MKPFCVGVDWGTSSFRLWLLGVDGTVLAERRSGEGLRYSAMTGFENVLEAHLKALEVEADLPVIICGMAGSAQGWQDAGYCDTPADLAQISGRAVVVEAARDVRILGGIAQRDTAFPDVMRGEETQLLGLSGAGLSYGLACLPGTHSKWAHIEKNCVQQFATFMSGELFAILSEHSILSMTMEAHDKAGSDDPAFLGAVRQAVDAPAQVSNQLFGVRASLLLGFGQSGESAAKLSGTLIGLEIAGAKSRFGDFDEVQLVVSGSLGALYASALKDLGIAIVTHDAEKLVRDGLLTAARAIWL